MRLKFFLYPFSLKKATRPLSGLLFAFLFAFLLTGCGGGSSGRDSFVATPGGDGGTTAPVGTGSVTYNFVRAQADPIVVPQTTQRVRFEFFTGFDGTGSLVKTAEEPFAAQITIDGVPVTANSSVVTALDGNGFPTFAFASNVEVIGGQTTTVSMSDGTGAAVTLDGLRSSPAGLSLGLEGSVTLQISALFSNGDAVLIPSSLLGEVEFESSDTGIATVDGNGTVSAVLQGDTIITISFRGQTTQVAVLVGTGNVIPPSVTSLTVSPTSFELPAGTRSPAVVATATFSDETTRTITQAQGLLWSSDNDGISVTEDNQIAVSGALEAGDSAVVTFSYLGQTANVQVFVQEAVLQSIQADPASVDLPFGGFEKTVTVSGTFSNGEEVEMNLDEITFSESSPLFNVDANGLITTTTAGTAGTDPLTIRLNSDPEISTQVSVGVGNVVVNSLTVSPTNPVLGVGDFVEFEIFANLSNEQPPVDITDFAALQTTLAGDGVVFNQGRVVATVPDSTATVTFTLPGAGPNGNDAVVSVNVTVQKIKLLSVEYYFAGNPIVENAVNLPRGYVGIFQVLGTFNNGEVRMLRPFEYTLEEVGLNASGQPIPQNLKAVSLFNSSYQLPAVRPEFQPLANSSALVRRIRTVVPYNPDDDNANSSNFERVVASDGFRAVVADWRRGGFDPIAVDNIQNPGNFDRYIIHVDDELEADDNPNEFTSNAISVTVTDPDFEAQLSADTGTFFNYPEDGRLINQVPREFEIRLDFQQRSLQDQGQNEFVDPPSLPPSVNPQPRFRLAEANVLFETDGPDGNPNLLQHRPDEWGFPTLISINPTDVAAIDIQAQPVGGVNFRNELIIAGGNPVWQTAYDIFGPSGAISDFERVEVDGFNGWLTAVRLVFERVDNNGTGFDIIPASVVTLDPIEAVIQVGAGQVFRSMIRFGTDLPLEDRSLDYRPVLVPGPSAVTKILEDGNAVISGTTVGSAVIRMLDSQGREIQARGGNVEDSNGNVGPATTTVNIDIVSPTP